MDYHCDVCDKTINFKTKRKHLQNLSHNEFDKGTQKKHKSENTDFSNIDELCNNYITKHNKKFD